MRASGLFSVLLIAAISLLAEVNAAGKAARQDFGSLTNSNYYTPDATSYGASSYMTGSNDYPADSTDPLAAALSSSYLQPASNSYAQPLFKPLLHSYLISSSNNWNGGTKSLVNPQNYSPYATIFPGYPGLTQPQAYSAVIPFQDMLVEESGLWYAMKKFFRTLWNVIIAVPLFFVNTIRRLFGSTQENSYN